jgi:hypothetical protein
MLSGIALPIETEIGDIGFPVVAELHARLPQKNLTITVMTSQPPSSTA